MKFGQESSTIWHNLKEVPKMRVGDIVSFRKDLLFNGAVQINWLEIDKAQAEKAARHYIFHGPKYHGVLEEDLEDGSHKLVDTASFTLDVIERVSGKSVDDPFLLAISGYGTGKSHLGVTLASLLSNPVSTVSQQILENLTMSDKFIGDQTRTILKSLSQPFLVIAVNGMQDFDLSGEIVRQVLQTLNNSKLDTTILENLRPRFKYAINFAESFFSVLKDEFANSFGKYTKSEIVEKLKHQDEEIFCKVNEIYEQKMGESIRAVGQESLHDFIRITKENYCGNGKPFAGIAIIFDEFGRYLEFSVQKPHIAGSGALQQLFETVQANSDKVFLLSFIQYELKAYISRVAPELREDLNRYVTRFDSVRKVRLSTNLETLISNLLEKKNSEELERQASLTKETIVSIQTSMTRWFPEIKNHALWLDINRFDRIIYKGCWPLHPISTWIFYKLSSAGKSLQQRSALSLLSDVFTEFHRAELPPGGAIVPVDLCNQAMVNEFLASERYGQQGATAHAFETVINKYAYKLSFEEKTVLKVVLLSTKIGVKIDSKQEYLRILAAFTGLEILNITESLNSLELDFGVLAWNERLSQYEIIEDAVPRGTFLAHLRKKVDEIDLQTRGELFSRHYKSWTQTDVYPTDFGSQSKISTREWNYKISYTSVQMLKSQINYSLRSWLDARGVEEEKGQLIYCYIGPESKIDTVKEMAVSTIRTCLAADNFALIKEVPLAIIFLNDKDGNFGTKIAEYWALQERMSEDERQKFSNFILHTKSSVQLELVNIFSELERERQIIYATDKVIKESRIINMLTDLFEQIYNKRIPFPFDGFHTARGNAARDCQVFTKELFMGNLDRDWISVCNIQQRNRAYSVLDESWGIIAEDGSIRMKPINLAVREIVEFIEYQVADGNMNGSAEPINVGKLIRILCFPPYGCNIASAGLILAVFIGRRRKELNLLRGKQSISIQNWLQDSMPGNFFDLSVLDDTEIVKISSEGLSEWEVLLEEWDMEPTLSGKISYLERAEILEERVPLPQQLHFKHKHLRDNALLAEDKLNEWEKNVVDALMKITRGKERSNVGFIIWGAVNLFELQKMMLTKRELWTPEQLSKVQEPLAHARLEIQQSFHKWLKQQTVNDIEQLSRFKHLMLERNGNNLKILGFTEEQVQLERHVAKVEEHIQLLTAIKNATSNINSMIQKNKVTNLTPISVLNIWLTNIEEQFELLKKAEAKTSLMSNDIYEATVKLKQFQDDCKNQILLHQKRMASVYNIEDLSSLSDIAFWRQEVAALILIFEGQIKDIEDLKLVQSQLDLIESHFRILDNENLTEEEFRFVIERCQREIEEFFIDDDPPLDCELIYEKLIQGIKEKRESIAQQWMKRNVFCTDIIAEYDAPKSMECKNRLGNMPSLLSEEQKNIVYDCISACEKRLDELEVEGLIIRFNALSEKNKTFFLKKLGAYVQKILDFNVEKDKSS